MIKDKLEKCADTSNNIQIKEEPTASCDSTSKETGLLNFFLSKFFMVFILEFVFMLKAVKGYVVSNSDIFGNFVKNLYVYILLSVKFTCLARNFRH